MTPPPVTAPYLATVVLLGAAGTAKLARPNDTARALATAGLPGDRRLVRIGALVEVAVALAALVAPGPWTGALVAAAYAAFATFVAAALRNGWPLSSCGCFGRPDTPPTRAHLALNAGACAAAVWWAAAWPGHDGINELARAVSRQPWNGGPLLLVTAVISGLAYLVWTNPIPAARR